MIRIDGEKGEKGEFAVNSFYLGRKMKEGAVALTTGMSKNVCK